MLYLKEVLATALPELGYGLKLFSRLCYSHTREVCLTEIHPEPHFDVTPQLNNCSVLPSYLHTASLSAHHRCPKATEGSGLTASFQT